MKAYIRTCQECGNRQIAKPPAEYKSDSWQDLKCKKCHSIGLDYGSSQEVDPNTLARIYEDD